VAPTLAQTTHTLQQRYTNVQRAPHTRFDQGMVRDVASWELPEGAAYDVVDMLCDYVGKVRKRGGTTSPASGNSAATVENILGYKSNGVDGTTGLFGTTGKGGSTLYTFNPSTGASSIVGFGANLNDTFACRPFQHGNLIVLSFQALGTAANTRNILAFNGGGTGSGSASTGVVTAQDNRITGLTGAGLTSAAVGSIIELENATPNYYIGRIVEVTTATSVRVEPVPQFGFTPTSVTVSPFWDAATQFGTGATTGRYGVSYQNRIVLGATLTTTGQTNAALAKGLDYKPNRVAWTSLPTEPPLALHAGVVDGESVLYPTPFTTSGTVTTYNFQDIPNLGGMAGLAVAGEGQLIIFGPRSTFRITGQLDTETQQSPAFDFTEQQVSSNVGLLPNSAGSGQRSIQYTRSGIVFAGNDNIYAFDGAEMRPLMDGRNARYYQDRIAAGDRPVGSAYSLNRNHYVLSMNGSDTSAIVINLATYGMQRFRNVQLFDSTPDPSNAAALWGVRYWDTTSAAPTMTKGQLIRIDPIWAPTQSNANDADGSPVLFDYQSASYLDGTLSTDKLPNDVQITRDHRGTGTPTATLQVDTKLNTSDASWVTVDAAMPATTTDKLSKAYPIGTLLAEGPAVEFRVTGNNACASFELLGLDVGTKTNPEGFSRT
jgi:hypothetical protein